MSFQKGMWVWISYPMNRETIRVLILDKNRTEVTCAGWMDVGNGRRKRVMMHIPRAYFDLYATSK